ncbi:uncharacterized protein BYT42DRAFT_358806 [Radiomyces spectabilis]|uniref:uncharacterized protein n=1 Tax=Radiomyces spectabilis TaxID=64574 RepID=UPI002220D0B4|nr:uncharacterized protein BYT42DRAFT_358806 [Radiomyces spectabilis]KAI8377826.1 hypothetical protein BYT42DRAFT_358806 [Radiomyces spectabilis]
MNTHHHAEYERIVQRYEALKNGLDQQQRWDSVFDVVRDSLVIRPQVTGGDRRRRRSKQRPYFVYLSGVKIVPAVAVEIIRRYCLSLPCPTSRSCDPSFDVFRSGDGFRCALKLPSSAPFGEITSSVESTRILALDQAAVSACILLHSYKALDKILLEPDWIHQYITPEFWLDERQSQENKRYVENARLMDEGAVSAATTVCQLYMSIINLSLPDGRINELHVRRLCLFTWDPLPVHPSFPLRSPTGDFQVSIDSATRPIRFTKTFVEILANVTIALLSAITDDAYFCLIENFPYFLAPLKSSNHEPLDVAESIDDLLSTIDWLELVEVAGYIDKPIKSDENKKFFTLPSNVNLSDIVFRRALPSAKDMDPTVLQSAYIIPPIMSRMDQLLLLQEVRSRFGAYGSDELMLQAFTTGNARDRHDYQSLETVGDSVLRVAAAIWVFMVYPNESRHQLNRIYEPMQTNNELGNRAIDANLGRYIKHVPFDQNIWKPLHYAVETHQNTKEEHEPINHSVHKKILADTVEASIAAVFLTSGLPFAFNYICQLSIFPNPAREENEGIQSWKELMVRHLATQPIPLEIDSDKYAISIVALEFTIGYRFKCKDYPQTFLTQSQSSYCNLKCERMMFLGRVVLQLLVIEYIFATFPNIGPGRITRLKGDLWHERCFAEVFFMSGLYENIPLIKGHFVNRISAVGDKPNGMSKGLLKELWTKSPTVPRHFANLLIILFAGVFLDAEFDWNSVKTLFTRFFNDYLQAYHA